MIELATADCCLSHIIWVRTAESKLNMSMIEKRKWQNGSTLIEYSWNYLKNWFHNLHMELSRMKNSRIKFVNEPKMALQPNKVNREFDELNTKWI